MTREKMTALLAETICVPVEEAREALESREWNVLGAAQLLQAKARARKAEAAQSALRGCEWKIVRVIRGGLERIGRIHAHRDDAAAPALTSRVLAPLMLMPSVYQSL